MVVLLALEYLIRRIMPVIQKQREGRRNCAGVVE